MMTTIGRSQLSNTQRALGRSAVSAMSSEAMYQVLANTSGSLDPDWFNTFAGLYEDRVQALAGILYASDSAPELRYPFEVFERGSTNLGLRLVFRQEWKPLGAQPGEIVKTIPLGPGEKQRVSTKVVRRRKVADSLESTTTRESSTERADTTKDSNEILNETASTFNWSESLNVHGSFGDLFGGSSTTNLGGSSEDKSKNTSSHLSEAVQKTANKIRRETKVIVSTEREDTFTQENASEISNNNNEVAVTYEYYKLQQQYQIHSYLAELGSVIYVAEQLPTPWDITEDWVRRHDWILARALKDESYRSTLNELIQDVPELDPAQGSQSVLDPAAVGANPFAELARVGANKFAQFNQQAAGGNPPNQGLSIPDIYAEPQRGYTQYLRDEAARKRANDLRLIRRARLLRHFRDNILYYSRAIWIAEDPDERLLRYKKENRQVAIQWSASLAQILRVGVVRIAQTTPPDQLGAVWELIDPTGPLGYNGNYAVFAMRPLPPDPPPFSLYQQRLTAGDFPITLLDVMTALRQPYFSHDPITSIDSLVDPALRAYQQQAAGVSDQELAAPKDDLVLDIVIYLPRLRDSLVDANWHVLRQPGPGVPPNGVPPLQHPIAHADFAEYLYRKNGTRFTLVDSNNVYLGIRTSEGAALEPFKRAHRYLDVLKAREDVVAAEYRNLRRQINEQNPALYDPDIDKVVVVSNGNAALADSVAAEEVRADLAQPPPDRPDGVAAPESEGSAAPESERGNT